MALDNADIEAIADRVVQKLSGRRAPRALVDARALADELGVDRDWVYAHSEELGVIRLGTGPKAPLRFDVQRARDALTAMNTDGSQTAPEPPPRRASRAGSASGLKRIRERPIG